MLQLSFSSDLTIPFQGFLIFCQKYQGYPSDTVLVADCPKKYNNKKPR
jgi:hypothetical protein